MLQEPLQLNEQALQLCEEANNLAGNEDIIMPPNTGSTDFATCLKKARRD